MPRNDISMLILDLGITDFLEAYRLQVDLAGKVAHGLCEDTLLITEHKPVITIGRAGSERNILKSREWLFCRGIDIISTDRGGDVTYHGPGQLVAYPVFRLENEARDIHGFLSFLEEVGGHFLVQYGIFAEKKPGFRGIWVSGKKIGSIGIGVKKWVTYHGLAINMDLDLSPFSFIRPCGIEGIEITSLRDVLDCEVDIDDAKHRLVRAFKEVPLMAEAVGKD